MFERLTLARRELTDLKRQLRTVRNYVAEANLQCAAQRAKAENADVAVQRLLDDVLVGARQP